MGRRELLCVMAWLMVFLASACESMKEELPPLQPGQEQCNGVDDDDDGEIDEEDAWGCAQYYMDQDGDGFGIDESRCLCSPSGGYSAVKKGDCMD